MKEKGIISCPGCKKSYNILSYLTKNKSHYKLHCNYCGKYWQEHIDAPLPIETAPPPHGELGQHFQVRPPAPKFSSTWNDVMRHYSLDWIMGLSGVGVLVMLLIYYGSSMSSNFNTFSVPPKNTSELAEAALAVENVEFTLGEKNNQLWLLVRGNIINPSQVTIPAPDLHIKAWGPCAEEYAAATYANKLCLIAQWLHHMQGASLGANSRKGFEAGAPIPRTATSTTVSEIEILTKGNN